MSNLNLHQLVFQAAQEILAEGKYPTIDLICQRLKLNPQEISSVLDIEPSNSAESVSFSETEMLEALMLINRLKERKMEQNNNNNNNIEIETETQTDFEVDSVLEEPENPDYVSEMVSRADRKAQYMAAAELVLTQELYRYYRNTQRFSETEVKKEVEKALADTNTDWENDTQNFSPAVILKKYGKSIH